MAIVNLCRVPFLDKNYVNVVDFSSSTTRRNYFTQRTFRQCNSNTKLDTERKEITLDLPYNALETFDYLGVDGDNLYNEYWKQVKSAD